MTTIQELTEEIKALSREELAAFRKWFQGYDAANWDRLIEEDAATGKFDSLAEKALAEHGAGKTSEI